MRQEKKQKDKPAIVLLLCFCVIALIAIFAVKNSIDKIQSNMGADQSTEVVKEKPVSESEQKDSGEKAANEIVDSRDHTSENSSDTSAADFIVPLSGDIIMEYSTNMPIYWKTLDQYMTHDGIDISAPAGSSVKACAHGTVTKIDEDDRFGILVEINHGNGVISKYGNLARKGLIELGEVVSKGDPIGQIGQSSMFEFDEEDHLHFAMTKDETPVNPGEYIKELSQ